MHSHILVIALSLLSLSGGLLAGSWLPLDLSVPQQPNYKTVAMLLRGEVLTNNEALGELTIAVTEKRSPHTTHTAHVVYGTRTGIDIVRYITMEDSSYITGIVPVESRALLPRDEVIVVHENTSTEKIQAYYILSIRDR